MAETKKTNVVPYVIVTTQEQANSGYSLEAQREKQERGAKC